MEGGLTTARAPIGKERTHDRSSCVRRLTLSVCLLLGACGTRTALDLGGGGGGPFDPTDPSPDATPGVADGGPDARYDAEPRPIPDGAPPDAGPRPDPGPRVQHLSAGWRHTCAVFAGQVWCWGFNGAGQLGDGTYMDRSEPVRVPGLDGIVEVSAGLQHSCARDSGGAMYCWGSNGIAQLGDGTFETRATPARINGLGRVSGIAAAGEHTCALLESGEARCWGHNAYGQVGDGTDVVRTVPTPVHGVTDAIQIEAGRRHTCALRRDRTVVCWGQMGRPIPEAQPISWATNARQIAAGRSGVLCILDDAGQVRCGFGDDHPDVIGQARHVSVGDERLCFADDRGVFCDGLGRIPGTEGAFQVSVGYEHACARLPTATVCFGRDELGQLGDGPGISSGTVRVIGL